MSIDHGEDDVLGGLALVTSVTRSMSGGDLNTPFVEVAQHDGSSYNWRVLLDEQKELMEEHGDEVARPDPDYGPSLYDPHEWK
jgi:hypothetical protein